MLLLLLFEHNFLDRDNPCLLSNLLLKLLNFLVFVILKYSYL